MKTARARPLTQSQFLAIGAVVKAELGPRPEAPRPGPLCFQGYRTISDAEFDRLMAIYNKQDDACRAWDRAFKGRFKVIEGEMLAERDRKVA